jgi:hypothetical protein
MDLQVIANELEEIRTKLLGLKASQQESAEMHRYEHVSDLRMEEFELLSKRLRLRHKVELHLFEMEFKYSWKFSELEKVRLFMEREF